MKVHLIWGAVLAAALVLFAWAERRAGAAEARAHATADSLAAVTHALTVRADSALAHQKADSARERQILHQITGQQQVLNAAQGNVARLAAILRDSAPASQRLVMDSLEALHAQRENILASQRDSAIALFTVAAARRDTLASLLAASQRQSSGLAAALSQASRKPIWETPALKLVEASLAVYGAARLLGR